MTQALTKILLGVLSFAMMTGARGIRVTAHELWLRREVDRNATTEATGKVIGRMATSGTTTDYDAVVPKVRRLRTSAGRHCMH
jgi:hypothetical protein